MLISVVNLTEGAVSQTKLRRYASAVTYQLERHFAPAWDMSARLEVADLPTKRRDSRRIDRLRGDAVIFVEANVRPSEYDGFHEANARGIPYGVVFVDLAEELEEEISVTLSHEAIELVADPQSNLLVPGPHPDRSKRRKVLFWYELCDAVQDESYEIRGVKVTNFVLPLYFTLGEQRGGQNDYLGRRSKYRLESFGVNPGGYVGYTYPANWHGEIYEPDARSKQRAAIKKKARSGRRSQRYQALDTRLAAFMSR
jgi:hypothetical protein